LVAWLAYPFDSLGMVKLDILLSTGAFKVG
jgi:hypothetical protein